ncbi:MAG: S-adenosyl methyltransferase [Actinomycetia bacterium]|nr:S-adenosyl methyltransferase [Actinomycetes bacterium]
MTVQNPAPQGVDMNVPNIARMYDYWLGGKDNFATCAGLRRSWRVPRLSQAGSRGSAPR